MSNDKKKKTWRNLIVMLSLAIVISYVLAYFVAGFFVSNFHFTLSVTLMYDTAVLVTWVVLFLLCVCLILFVLGKYKFVGYNNLISKTTKLDSSLHGSSEFQTQKELDQNYKKIRWQDIGQTQDAHGWVINSKIEKDGTVVVNRAQGCHCLTLAATRVGKTQYFLSPTVQFLGNCPTRPSMFITDPKGELYAANSAFLASQGYKIFTFNLAEPQKSNKYNPLGMIWDLYHDWADTGNADSLDEAEDLLREVSATISPEGLNSSDPTWDIGAQNIIQGLLTALLEDSLDPKFKLTKEKFTLWQLSHILTQETSIVNDFVHRREKTSPAKQRLSLYFKNDAKETIGSFLASTANKLNQYTDFGMTYIMSDTELDLNDIADKPYAIFCIVPDEKKAKYPLAVMFATQIYKQLIRLARKENDQKLKNEFYFILEEFGNFPKMDCIKQMLSIGGGRKIWTCLILQSLAQLDETYGKPAREIILNNLQLQIYMGVPANETNQYYSEFFGSKTVKKNNLQLSSADLTKDISGSTGAEKAMLILPDELSRLKAGEIVFKMFKHQPARTHLLAMFDQECLKKGIFKTGKVNIDWSPTKLNHEKLFYDLIERDNAFDGILDIEEIEDIEDGAAASETRTEKNTPVSADTTDHVLDFLIKIANGGK